MPGERQKQQSFSKALRVVVVGAGFAGCTAAVQLVRQGARVSLLDQRGQAGGLAQNAGAIENCPFVPRGSSGEEVVAQLRRWLSSWRLEVIPARIRALSHQNEQWQIFADNGQRWSADAVLLAVGTRPLPFSLPTPPKETGPPLLREIVDFHGSPKRRLAIIGGGDVACDFALSAVRHDQATVDLLLRGSSLKAISRLAQQVQATPQIHIHWQTEVVEALQESSGVVLLKLKKAKKATNQKQNAKRATDQEEKRQRAAEQGNARRATDQEGERQRATDQGETLSLRCQAVLAAIGRESALSMLELPPLGPLDRLDGATRQPGLYVIGDARRGRTGQMTQAAADGLAAASALQAKASSSANNLRPGANPNANGLQAEASPSASTLQPGVGSTSSPQPHAARKGGASSVPTKR